MTIDSDPEEATAPTPKQPKTKSQKSSKKAQVVPVQGPPKTVEEEDIVINTDFMIDDFDLLEKRRAN